MCIQPEETSVVAIRLSDEKADDDVDEVFDCPENDEAVDSAADGVEPLDAVSIARDVGTGGDGVGEGAFGSDGSS
jgi:hypothetical protein